MKINKHISILIAFLILVSNVGFAINVHYCKDKISSVTLAYKIEDSCDNHHKESEKKCCAASGESHESCCTDDIVKLQDNTDNVIVKSFQLDLAQFCTINEWKSLISFTEAYRIKRDIPSFYWETNAPPLFKLYCSYIFYA